MIDNILKEDLPLVGGGIAAGFVKNLTKKVTTNEKIQAAGPLILGMFMKRSKQAELRFAGYGMIAVGGRDFAGSFIPAIKGIEDMDLNGIFGGSDTIEDKVLNDDLSDDVSGNKLTGTSGEDYDS